MSIKFRETSHRVVSETVWSETIVQGESTRSFTDAPHQNARGGWFERREEDELVDR